MSIANNEFLEITSAFINLANELNKKWPEPSVIACLVYAAARYQSSNYISGGGTPENEAKTIAAFLDTYKSMLETNMADIRAIEARNEAASPASPTPPPSN